MKALSLTQPWATLVAIHAKHWETRSWQTSYRGQIAIHASKGFPRACSELCEFEPFKSSLNAAGSDLPVGAIIAVADLTEIDTTGEWTRRYCNPSLANYADHKREYTFGDYAPGRFAWRLMNVQKLKEPVPCKGALSIWTVPDDVAAEVERQLV